MSVVLTLLLSLLDSDNFRTREAASKALAKLAPLCWEQLYTVQGQSLEVTLRARKIADRHWFKVPMGDRQEYVAGFKPCGWSYLPWLHIERSKPYLDMHGGHGPADSWLVYRKATVSWLLDAAETMTPDGIRAELERMAAAELEWIAANPYAYRAAGGPRRHH